MLSDLHIHHSRKSAFSGVPPQVCIWATSNEPGLARNSGDDGGVWPNSGWTAMGSFLAISNPAAVNSGWDSVQELVKIGLQMVVGEAADEASEEAW